MNYLHLSIPYNDFLEQYKKFQVELYKLHESKLSVEVYSFNFRDLNKIICDFLQKSFNQLDNIFYEWYTEDSPREFNKKETDSKIIEINNHLELLKIADVIHTKNEELFKKRQRYTIKQKRELVLLSLSKLNESYYSIDTIYTLTGLKEDKRGETFQLGKQLENSGLANFMGDISGGGMSEITIEGIEYVQELEEDAYGFYTPDDQLTEKERTNLQNIFQELKDELKNDIRQHFKENQEFITTALNALYEVIEESLELIDSKLPKKTIKEAIIGKVVEKAGEKGLEVVMGIFLTKLKAKLMGETYLIEGLEKAQSFIGLGN